MFKSILHFSGTDPDPATPLAQILPLSRRAFALMIRSKDSPLLQEAFLNISGAIEMLAGLEYHHDNIVRMSAALAAGETVEETNLCHEAVAYVNRLGQFYYFARSPLVTRALGDGLTRIPTISKYIVFRNKHSAHRSMDAPRNESEATQQAQARSLSRVWGKMMTLKPGAPEVRWPRYTKAGSPEQMELHRQEWKNSYITFQLYDEDRDLYINLTIETEHAQICSDAYDLLSKVILWKDEPA